MNRYNLPLLTLVGALSLATFANADDRGAGKAADSRLERAFGSTIVSTYPDGRQAELWLKRDGSYNAEGRRHDRSSGAWQVKNDKDGDKLCMKQHKPLPFGSYCTPVPDGGLDKPWAGKAYTGEQISIRLVKGMFDPAAKDGDHKDGDHKAETRRSDDNG